MGKYINYNCLKCNSSNLTPINKMGDTCRFVCENCGHTTERLIYYKKNKSTGEEVQGCQGHFKLERYKEEK